MNTKNVRKTIIETAYEQGLSHVGSCLSCVEILGAIFDAKEPEDRFVLSAGHKALALYAVLQELGKLKNIDVKELGAHPQRDDSLGIYTSTGSLGHGLSHAVGMAYGDLASYALLSDGEIQEGSTYEAIRYAGSQRMDNLVAIVDCNGWGAYQPVNEFDNGSLWKSFGWDVRRVDGHNEDQLRVAITARSILFPTVVLAKTVKGKGLKRFEDQLGSHYWKIEKEDYEEYVRQHA